MAYAGGVKHTKQITGPGGDGEWLGGGYVPEYEMDASVYGLAETQLSTGIEPAWSGYGDTDRYGDTDSAPVAATDVMAYIGGSATAAADPLKSSGLLMEQYVTPPVYRGQCAAQEGDGFTLAIGVGALDGCRFTFAPDAARGRPSLYHIHQRPEPLWPEGLRVADTWEEQAEEQQRRRWDECENMRTRAGITVEGDAAGPGDEGEQDEVAALAAALGMTTSKDLNVIGGGGSRDWWRHELEGEGGDEEQFVAVARGSGIKGSSALRADRKRRQRQGQDGSREVHVGRHDGFADDDGSAFEEDGVHFWDVADRGDDGGDDGGDGRERGSPSFADDGGSASLIPFSKRPLTAPAPVAAGGFSATLPGRPSSSSGGVDQLSMSLGAAVSLPELQAQRQQHFNSLTLSHFDNTKTRSQAALDAIPRGQANGAIDHVATIQQWRQETAQKNAIGAEKRRDAALAQILDDRLDPTTMQIVTPVLPSMFLPSMSQGSLATLQMAPSKSLKMLTGSSKRLLPNHEFRVPADNLQPRNESTLAKGVSTSQNTPVFWLEMAQTLPFKVVGPVVRLSQVDGTSFPMKVKVRLPHCCTRQVATGKRRSKKKKTEAEPQQATVVLAVVREGNGSSEIEQMLEVYDAVEHVGLTPGDDGRADAGVEVSKKDRLNEQMAVEGWVGLQGSCIVAPVLIQPALSTPRPFLVRFVAFMPRSDIVADGVVLIRVWVRSHTPEQSLLAEELEEANRMWGSRCCGISAPTRVGLGEMLTVALDGQVARSRWLGKGPQCLDIHLRLPSFAGNRKKWNSSRRVCVYFGGEGGGARMIVRRVVTQARVVMTTTLEQRQHQQRQ
jgi:hypothetical protein